MILAVYLVENTCLGPQPSSWGWDLAQDMLWYVVVCSVIYVSACMVSSSVPMTFFSIILHPIPYTTLVLFSHYLQVFFSNRRIFDINIIWKKYCLIQHEVNHGQNYSNTVWLHVSEACRSNSYFLEISIVNQIAWQAKRWSTCCYTWKSTSLTQ